MFFCDVGICISIQINAALLIHVRVRRVVDAELQRNHDVVVGRRTTTTLLCESLRARSVVAVFTTYCLCSPLHDV